MKRSLVGILSLAVASCAAEEGFIEPPTGGGSRGVTQAGAQDIAHFRSLVEDGEVPAPALLDQVGFFAEHALDQPAAECGASVCAHPMLAVAPRFDSGTWTMAFVSLNSAVDPATRPREPVHVVLAVERSTGTERLLGSAGQTLDSLLADLAPEDRVSLVAFGGGAEILVVGATPTEASGIGANLGTPWRADVDLYAGIAAASEAVVALPDFQGSSRIVLLTTGASGGGIADPGSIEELASAIIQTGTSFSVVGMGDDYEAALPQRIADLGAGTYSFAEDAADLGNILRQEGGLRLLPLATEVELTITPNEGYTVGRLYGARRATVEGAAAVLRTPALFLGARTGPEDVGMGRRGGGGGLFVELLTDPEGPRLPAGANAYHLEVSYLDADSGERVAFEEDVVNDLRPAQRPDENWPRFSAPEYGKAFMMLNMYLALKATVELYASGDCGSALGVSAMMEPAIMEWQRLYQDPDIDADTILLYGLRDNVRPRCKSQPLPPSNYDAGCFAL